MANSINNMTGLALPRNVRTMKDRFNLKLGQKSFSRNSDFITGERYAQLIVEVENAKCKDRKRESMDYRRIARFDVLSVGTTKKLIVPISRSGNNEIIYFVSTDELFDIIHDAHMTLGHGGRCRLEKQLKSKYKNISRDAIMMYLNVCDVCHEKKRRCNTEEGDTGDAAPNGRGSNSKRRKSKVASSSSPPSSSSSSLAIPAVEDTMNSARVDLIDMQGCPDEEYKFIMVYRDHTTKFVVLRPLKTKMAAEVSYNLMDMFCLLGAPSVMYSDTFNGRGFVSELCDTWKGLKVVYGRPHHTLVNKSERSNLDVQNVLTTWMEENKSNRWSEGLRFCQFRKNNAYHPTIRQKPHEALFGQKVLVGLKSSAIMDAVIAAQVSDEFYPNGLQQEASLANMHQERNCLGTNHEMWGRLHLSQC